MWSAKYPGVIWPQREQRRLDDSAESTILRLHCPLNSMQRMETVGGYLSDTEAPRPETPRDILKNYVGRGSVRSPPHSSKLRITAKGVAASRPPSTGMTTPEIQRDSSLAK